MSRLIIKRRAQKPGDLRRYLKRLETPGRNNSALKTLEPRSSIGAAQGVGHENLSPAGSGGGFSGEYTSTDGLFSIIFE